MTQPKRPKMPRLTFAQRRLLRRAADGAKIFRSRGFGSGANFSDHARGLREGCIVARPATVDSLLRRKLLTHGEGFNEYRLTEAAQAIVGRM